MMREVAGGIGDPQVRNWGTIGGSVAHADPASRLAGRAARLHAPHRRAGVPSGERTIRARDFFIDMFTTAIEPTEVLTEIRIALPSEGWREVLQEARAAGRRFRHGRCRDRAGPRFRRTSRQCRHRGDGRLAFAVCRDRRRGHPVGQVPAEELLRRAGDAAAAPEPNRHPTSAGPRLQARDGRRDDGPGPPDRRRARHVGRIGRGRP